MSEISDRGRRLGWRVGVGVAVVGVATLGAFGIAAATSSSPADSPAKAAPADDNGDHGGPPWGGGWGGHWGGGGLAGGLLDNLGVQDVKDLSHADIVLVKDGGGSQTLHVQKGAVTSVDGGSVAVKSADGYAKTYGVTKDTKVNGDEKIATVAKKEQVVVVTKDAGDKPAATVVVDLTDLGWK